MVRNPARAVIRTSVPLLAAFAVIASGVAQAAPVVTNGGFESRMSGWSRESAGSGNWRSYTGTPTVCSGPFFAPPVGTRAAVSDAGAPGSHILHQEIWVPDDARRLNMLIYYVSTVPIATANTLDHTGPPVQQYRVDILKPAARVNTMNANKILATPFANVNGDPMVVGPIPVSLNMRPLRGEDVRLRFAEVSNLGCFNAAVDAVKITH